MMRKHVCLFFMLASFAVIATANPRTWQQKVNIAAAALGQNTATAKSHGGTPRALKALKSASALSVIGYEDGGFAIVSNDDQAAPLVGYSSGTFDEASNPGLRWFLAAADEVLSSAAQPVKVVAPSQYEGLKPEVGPLVKSTWNQGYPYNLLTPTYGTNKAHYVTGCVATAMAQVMYFHQYPSRGRNIHTYSFTPSNGENLKLTVDYGQETYDWSLMTDVYTGGESEASKLEVAKLMYDAGVSCSMQYNEDGSGAYTYEAANALVEYFNYNENLQLYTRRAYSEGLWMRKIFTEIDAGRPIMYAGTDVASGGHEFVLDGYNADGFVHINWGWGSTADGYFDIALLNPTGFQFSVGQEMVMGIATPETAIAGETQLFCNGDVAYTPSTVTPDVMAVNGTVMNIGRSRYTGPMAVVLADESGSQQVVKYFTNASKRGSDTPVDYDLFHNNSASLTIRTLRYGDILSEKPDGTYRIFIATRAGEVWSPVHAPAGKVNSALIVKSGANYTLASDTDDMWMFGASSTATGISSVRPATKAPATDAVYNLAGQRVGAGYKGIAIRNGRKVLVR